MALYTVYWNQNLKNNLLSTVVIASSSGIFSSQQFRCEPGLLRETVLLSSAAPYVREYPVSVIRLPEAMARLLNLLHLSETFNRISLCY